MDFVNKFDFRKRLSELEENQWVSNVIHIIVLLNLPFGCIIYSIMVYYMKNLDTVSWIYFVIAPILLAFISKSFMYNKPNVKKLSEETKIPLEVIKYGIDSHCIESLETLETLQPMIIPQTSMVQLREMFKKVNFVETKEVSKDV